MGGWREAKRLPAGGTGARETMLQDIFNGWADRTTPVAGAPDWLWVLPNPKQPTLKGFGYEFKPDAYWEQSTPRMVGELKYGAKFEPIAIAEAVHHAHLLRRLSGGEAVRSVLITQQNYWIRAAVAELAHPEIHHIEADLLTLDKTTLLWLSCPHASLSDLPSMPGEAPLKQDWTSLKWSEVVGEPTWIAHDGTHKPPFIQGPVAMLSRFRNSARYKWVLWTGQLPTLDTKWSQNDWAEAGVFWVWDADAEKIQVPLPPPG